MHQTMTIVLKTLLLLKPPQTPQYVLHCVDDILATTMYSMIYTISTAIKANTGSLAFPCDVPSNIPVITEWQTITYNSDVIVNNVILKRNHGRIDYDY